MKINVMISLDKTITLDVDPNESIENVKALLEVQANVMLPQQRLFYNNSEMKNWETLRGLGVKNGDLLTLVSKNSSVLRGRDLSLNPYGSAVNQLHRDSSRMTQLSEKAPEFALALSRNDLDKVQDILRSRNEKWAAAVEYHPQGVFQEIMLCVDMEVNGVPVKALVDSGAGTSFITRSFAERCGLLALLDHNVRGIAVGIGQREIVGCIHSAPIKIGNNFYPCPFMVFDFQETEIVLGLDMLRKHKDNTLKLEGGKFSVPFLQEKDIPSGCLRVGHLA